MEEWREFLTQTVTTDTDKAGSFRFWIFPNCSSAFNNDDYHLPFLAYPKEKEVWGKKKELAVTWSGQWQGGNSLNFTFAWIHWFYLVEGETILKAGPCYHLMLYDIWISFCIYIWGHQRYTLNGIQSWYGKWNLESWPRKYEECYMDKYFKDNWEIQYEVC